MQTVAMIAAMIGASAATMEGGTCDDLPPLTHGGSWEPTKQHQKHIGSAELCCETAAGAWTYYLRAQICVVDTGDGTRAFHPGAPAAYR